MDQLDKPDKDDTLPSVIVDCAFCGEASEIWHGEALACKSCGHPVMLVPRRWLTRSEVMAMYPASGHVR